MSKQSTFAESLFIGAGVMVLHGSTPVELKMKTNIRLDAAACDLSGKELFEIVERVNPVVFCNSR